MGFDAATVGIACWALSNLAASCVANQHAILKADGKELISKAMMMHAGIRMVDQMGAHVMRRLDGADQRQEDSSSEEEEDEDLDEEQVAMVGSPKFGSPK